MKCMSLQQLELSPEVEEALYVQGYSQYQQGHYKEAGQCFQRLAAGCRKNSRYWFALAACYQMLQYYDGAVAFYLYAAMLSPENPFLYLHAAECLFSLNKIEAALSALGQVEQIVGDQKEYHQLTLKVQAMRIAWKLEDQIEETHKSRKKSWWAT